MLYYTVYMQREKCIRQKPYTGCIKGGHKPMEKTQSSKKGTLRVSENVIVTIVKNTASEIDGIFKIAAKPLSIKGLLQGSADPSDIKVSMLDGVCRISMSVIAKSGFNIVSVCEEVQEKVKSAVQSMTGVTVSKVDISVVDVSFEAEPETI